MPGMRIRTHGRNPDAIIALSLVELIPTVG